MTIFTSARDKIFIKSVYWKVCGVIMRCVMTSYEEESTMNTTKTSLFNQTHGICQNNVSLQDRNRTSDEYTTSTINFELGYYFLSLSVALYATIMYTILIKTIHKHDSLQGTRVTILKFICAFDMSHVYLQSIAIYLCNNYSYSVVWHVIRFLLHVTFVISLALNPLMTVNQCMKLKFGLVYQKLIARIKVKRKIFAVIFTTFWIHVACFVSGYETYLFAILLSIVCLTISPLTGYILYVASRPPITKNLELRRWGMKQRKSKKSHLTKIFLFVILAIFISMAVFSIKHGGRKINYNGIKTATFFACTYVVITPLVHIWTMPDLKLFFVKDLVNYKNNFSMWYESIKKGKNEETMNNKETLQEVHEDSLLQCVTKM